MRRLFTALLAFVAVVGLARAANAQYMYLDSNGNGIHSSGDRLNPNGTPTTVDLVRSNKPEPRRSRRPCANTATDRCRSMCT